MLSAEIRPSAAARPGRTYALLLVTIVLNASGNVLLSVGMKETGPLGEFALTPLVAAAARTLTTRAVAAGVLSLIVFYVLHLVLLSWADYSFVVPATAASFIAVPLLASLVGGETVSRLQWTGIVLVACGVILVARTPVRTTGEQAAREPLRGAR
jgi:drug/metabolite transporter (DMT)-like permease